MLTTRSLYQHVDSVVDDAYLRLIVLLIGADLLTDDQKRRAEQEGLITGQRPIVDLLYVLLRNRPDQGYQATLNALAGASSSQPLPVLNDAQQATLDTARAAVMEALESTKAEVKKQFRQQVVDLNRQHRQQVAVHRIETVSSVKQHKDDLIRKLLALIPTLMLAAQESFERSFSSVLTDTVNDIVVDAATADSLFTGVPPKDVIVYKIVKNDDALCQWCARFYRNPDGTPKLFTLAELQANGSNYGKPKSEWKPTLGKTHVRCRCELFYRRPQK